jgi:hypothetical protein
MTVKAPGAVWLARRGDATLVRGEVDGDRGADFALRILDGAIRPEQYDEDEFLLVADRCRYRDPRAICGIGNLSNGGGVIVPRRRRIGRSLGWGRVTSFARRTRRPWARTGHDP